MKTLIFIGSIAMALCLYQCQSDNKNTDITPVLSVTANASIVSDVPSDSFSDADENIITQDTSKKKNPEQKKMQDGSRLVISFISKGGGIDRKTKKSFEKMIVDFNTANKCNVVYTLKTWGKEGERDYCFSFGQGDFLEKFVSEAKEKLKGKELIQVKENTECRK